MNLEKLKPWNWFKHEEGGNGGAQRIPVSREQAQSSPYGTGSLLELHREMDQWFDQAFKSFGMPSLASRLQSKSLGDGGLPGLYRPQLDISGDDNQYEITLDLPGLTQDDISLELQNDVLVIRGQKEERKEDKDKHYYRVERSYGSFQRMLTLPDDANADEIGASLDKGVLRLTIPRRGVDKQDVKRISISS